MLANYIKQRELACTIPAVRSLVRELLTATVDINQAFKEFYSNLYSSTSTSSEEEIHKFTEPLGLPKLTEEQRDFLDSDITIEENKGALPSSKAPGPASFTGEFFKSFVTELALPLQEVHKEVLERGILPPTLRRPLLV